MAKSNDNDLNGWLKTFMKTSTMLSVHVNLGFTQVMKSSNVWILVLNFFSAITKKLESFIMVFFTAKIVLINSNFLFRKEILKVFVRGS